MLFNSERRNGVTKMRNRLANLTPVKSDASRLIGGVPPRGRSTESLCFYAFCRPVVRVVSFTPPPSLYNCIVFFYEVLRFANGATALLSSWGPTSGPTQGAISVPLRGFYFSSYAPTGPVSQYSTNPRDTFSGRISIRLFARDAVGESEVGRMEYQNVYWLFLQKR